MKLSKEKSCTHGFTLVEIAIVTTIIGLLAVMAIPAYARSRTLAAEVTCERNLQHIEDAKAQWAMDVRKGKGAKPKDQDLFGPTGYIRNKPECPSGGTYELNKIKDAATCTFQRHALE